MGFLAIMALVLFVLVTALVLLAAAASERVHRTLDALPLPWQIPLGVAGLAVGVPLVIVAHEGAALLAYAIGSLLAGLRELRNARRSGPPAA